VKPAPALIRALRDPSSMALMAIGEWDLLVRQARGANVLASLYYIVADQHMLQRIPAQAREVLEWSRVVAERHAQAARFEVAELTHVLAELGLPLILLKGSAYLAAGLPPAPGRLFSDLDILVPKQRIDDVEAALMLAGWAGTMPDHYDQRYYRQWMHELPPMQHMRRQSMLDVHHAILPETAAMRPDPVKLRAAARPVAGAPGVQVLAPADMVLHSAVHLFCDGEFDKGLRDLFDIHRLLQHFGAMPGFWDELPRRARELELDRPLFYALRYASQVLGTRVPATTQFAADSGRPNRLLLAVMDRLFARALKPGHASCADRFSVAARFLLYVRGNWLRMPPVLLACHLFHQAFIAPKAARNP
jgi:hypothetical protein